LESQIGDFLGGRVNLLVIIPVEFMVKNPLGVFDFFDVFSDTGADESVLEPAIGAFHFAFGLRGQGISDFYITILEDLFPLRGGFIGQEVMLSPERVPSLNEAEDAMGVYIVSVRESKAEDDRLEGQDMGPTGFLFEQSGIKDQSTEIIQGGDEIPFFLGSGCPEMIRGVVLDQFSRITGEDFPIMESSFGFLEIKAVPFGSADDGGQGYFLMMGLPQSVFDVISLS
jgi:hypothetical protein